MDEFPTYLYIVIIRDREIRSLCQAERRFHLQLGTYCSTDKSLILPGLIAATALRHNLILVACNARDFEDTGAQIIHPWG
jgi:hypothetical protein